MPSRTCIGYVTNRESWKKESSVSKSELASFPIQGPTEVQQLFFGTNKDLFALKETETGYFYKVEDEFLENGLVAFFKALYADLHGENAECREIISKLEDMPTAEGRLKLARNKYYERFQMDAYGYDYLYKGGSSLVVNYHSILLALEGKTMMETYGTQFDFFERLIR